MSPRQVVTPSITMQDVAVIRGNRLVFDDFSMASQAGELVWIRGANGSGKSTLLRLVAELLPKASGMMTVTGATALADESLALDANLTLAAALSFWAKLDEATLAQCEQALVAMDLMQLADVPVRYLSNGQRKRATLSRLFASHAPIWLLDEPYNGLDSANATRLDAALLMHIKDGGIALVAAHQAPSINVSQSILLDRQTVAA